MDEVWDRECQRFSEPEVQNIRKVTQNVENCENFYQKSKMADKQE